MTNSHSLPAELTICSVAETRQAWLAWPELGADAASKLSLAEGEPLTVDASTVHEIDAAGLQLLLSLHRTLQARGRLLALRQPSATLCRASEVLGLVGFLGLATAEGEAA